MADRTSDATPTLDLGPGGDERRVEPPSAFDPPAARFDTIGELGRGGMGRVDDAYDRALGRPVAIKHMLSASAVDKARFEREARITARLEHPGIVPIHDAGRSPDGTPYYVMRRVDGRPLDALVTERLSDRLGLIPNVLAACDAVAFAHARGIVHRDIKPTNILVGPFGETLVIDWGLAREIGDAEAGGSTILPSDPQLTRAGTVAGTPGFMAPEQARGEAVDARADVFALGSTLFYVLSGELPYGSASATEMVDLVGAGRTPNWRVVPTDVPNDLRAIAMKAMASDATERYADAAALAADLRRFITGNLVGAYEYGWWSRLVRFVRRHRAAVAIAIVSVLVLVVGATMSLRRIVAERDDATTARELAEARQRDATAMADRLLVTHARELADSDPVAAIMTLRRLPPDSTRWHDAWVAAAAAWSHGISYGFGNDSPPTMIEANGSGSAFALWGYNGDLVVIDLAARTRRAVAMLGRGNQAHWISPHTVAFIIDGNVGLVDTITGAIRKTELAATSMIGDHDSTVWIETPDHRVVELRGPDARERELLRGFDQYDAPPDLSKAVVQRGRALELWLPSGTIPIMKLATPTTQWHASFGAHDLAITDGTELWTWEIAGSRLVEHLHITRPRVLVVWAGGIWFQFDLTDASMSMLGPDGHTAGARLIDVGLYYPTRAGLVALSNNGALQIFDDEGRFTLGPSSMRFLRADASIDKRFVIASASNGDIVIWDLALVRPAHVMLTPGEHVVDVTAHYLWSSIADQLVRTDFVTRTREIVLPFAASVPSFGVDGDERFAWGFDQKQQAVRLYDAGEHTSRVFTSVAFAWSSPAGLTFATDAGDLVRWEPGTYAPHRLGSFHAPLLDLVVADRFALGVTKADTFVRLELATGGVETTHLDAAHYMIAPSGRVWLSSGTKVWRWDRGRAPIVLEIPEAANDLSISGERVVLHTQHSIIEIADTTPHSISIDAEQLSWRGDTPIFAVASAQDTVSVVERASGLGFALGTIVRTSYVAARGRKIAFIDRFIDPAVPSVAIWTLAVPDDPTALQRWLATITNARSVPDSDAHTWP